MNLLHILVVNICCSATHTFEYIPISFIKSTILHDIILEKSFFFLIVTFVIFFRTPDHQDEVDIYK